MLSVDPIESAIVTAGIARSFETGLAAYVVAEALAGGMLGAGLSVVIDAVNAVEEARAMWPRLARTHGADLRIIECRVSDEAVHADRVTGRQRGLAIPEPSWEDVARRLAEWKPWPEPHLTLDAIDSVATNVARALAYIDLP